MHVTLTYISFYEKELFAACNLSYKGKKNVKLPAVGTYVKCQKNLQIICLAVNYVDAILKM